MVMSKNILVTGAAGFIGSWVVDELVKEGHSVVGLDDLSGGFKRNINNKITFIKGNICNESLVDSLIKEYDIDYVYHLAAYAAEGLSHYIRGFNYSTNLLGSVNLINSSIKQGVKKFLFTSSMAVYGSGSTPMCESDIPNPEDPYGISKLGVEQDLKAANELFGMDYCIIRPHNCYGVRQNIYDKYRNVIGIFMNQIMNKQPPTIFGDGKQTRAFSNIKDVAPCIAKALFTSKASGQIINVGAAEPYSINQIAKIVCDAMGTKLKPIHIPNRFEVKHAHCSIKKSQEILGYKTSIDLKEGINEMAIWAKQLGPKKTKIWKKLEIEKEVPRVWIRS